VLPGKSAWGWERGVGKVDAHLQFLHMPVDLELERKICCATCTTVLDMLPDCNVATNKSRKQAYRASMPIELPSTEHFHSSLIMTCQDSLTATDLTHYLPVHCVLHIADAVAWCQRGAAQQHLQRSCEKWQQHKTAICHCPTWKTCNRIRSQDMLLLMLLLLLLL
jgi:hypothetical protein